MKIDKEAYDILVTAKKKYLKTAKEIADEIQNKKDVLEKTIRESVRKTLADAKIRCSSIYVFVFDDMTFRLHILTQFDVNLQISGTVKASGMRAEEIDVKDTIRVTQLKTVTKIMKVLFPEDFATEDNEDEGR